MARVIKIYVGAVMTSKHNGDFEVVSKQGRQATVRFLSTGYTCTKDVTNLYSGGIRDLLYPSNSGVGFVGEGEFLPRDHKRCYKVWAGMIQRCYTEWKLGQVNYTYNLCTVDTQWHNFQNFAKWYTQQKMFKSFELDKDLLDYGNKVYSEDSCSLLPHEINTALQDKQRNSIEGFPGVHFKKANQNYVAQMSVKGSTSKHIGSYSTPEAARFAYLKAKVNYLVALAEKYKSDLDVRVYAALIAWSPA